MEQQVTPILTINGSDGTGGAGIQADIKTISALGGRALSAITSITAQNTLGIQEFYDLPAETIKGQIEAIVNDMQPAVVKVGMIRRADTVAQIAQLLRQHKPRHVIYDPVIVSSQNEMLMAQEVVHEVRRSLLPLCSLVLMKRADAERLTQTAINTAADLNQAVKSLLAAGCRAATWLRKVLPTYLQRRKTANPLSYPRCSAREKSALATDLAAACRPPSPHS